MLALLGGLVLRDIGNVIGGLRAITPRPQLLGFPPGATQLSLEHSSLVLGETKILVEDFYGQAPFQNS